MHAQKRTWGEEVELPEWHCLVFIVKFLHVFISLREPIGQRGYEKIQ